MTLRDCQSAFLKPTLNNMANIQLTSLPMWMSLSLCQLGYLNQDREISSCCVKLHIQPWISFSFFSCDPGRTAFCPRRFDLLMSKHWPLLSDLNTPVITLPTQLGVCASCVDTDLAWLVLPQRNKSILTLFLEEGACSLLAQAMNHVCFLHMMFYHIQRAKWTAERAWLLNKKILQHCK